MKMNMKKHLKSLAVCAFVLLETLAFSQSPEAKNKQPYIRNQFNVNLAVLKTFGNSATNPTTNFPLCPSLEINYGLNDWLEVGLMSTFRIMTQASQNSLFSFHTIDAKAHLFPVVIDPSFHIADLYATVQAGLCHYPGAEGLGVASRVKACWGGNVGIAFNPTRHFGLFAEYGYNSAYYFKSYLRFGVSVRFGGPRKWQQSGQ